MPVTITLTDAEIELRQTLLDTQLGALTNMNAATSAPKESDFARRMRCFTPLFHLLENEIISAGFVRLRRLILQAMQTKDSDPLSNPLLDILFSPQLADFWTQWLNDSHTHTLIAHYLGVIYHTLSSSFTELKAVLNKTLKDKTDDATQTFLTTLSKLPNNTLPQVILSQLNDKPMLRASAIDSLYLITSKKLLEKWKTELDKGRLTPLQQRFLRYTLSPMAKTLKQLDDCLTQSNVYSLVKAMAYFDTDKLAPHSPHKLWKDRLKQHHYSPAYKFISHFPLHSPSHPPLKTILTQQQYNHCRLLLSYHLNCLEARIQQQQQSLEFGDRLRKVYLPRRVYKLLPEDIKSHLNAPLIITGDETINLKNLDSNKRVNSALHEQSITSFILIKDDLHMAAKLGSYHARQAIAQHHYLLFDYHTYHFIKQSQLTKDSLPHVKQAHLAFIHALNMTRQAMAINPGPGHVLRGITLIKIARRLSCFSPRDEKGIIRHRTFDDKQLAAIKPKRQHNPQSLFGSAETIVDWRQPLTEANSPFPLLFSKKMVDARTDILNELILSGLALIRHVRDNEAKYSHALESAGFPSPIIFPDEVQSVGDLYDHCCSELGMQNRGTCQVVCHSRS